MTHEPGLTPRNGQFYSKVRCPFPPLVAEALAAVMAEAAMPEHDSPAEMELSDAPDPIPVLSTDALISLPPYELMVSGPPRGVAGRPRNA